MISGAATLFHWSLRADTRSHWPHIVRAGFALFMLLSISAAYADVFGATGPGLLFFQNISLLNVLLIAVAGISYFVSAVTEEKDTGNLALLQLAGVSPLAIILGKSTSRLISSLMLLLIQLPFTFLSITLGGVMWQQIVASYLALAAWMALVSNLALICSVRCQTSGRAAALAGALLLLFFTVEPVLSAFLTALPPGWLPAATVSSLNAIVRWQQTVSVTLRLKEILAVTSSSPQLLAPQFWWNLGAAGGLFVLSTLLFNHWAAPVDAAVHGSSAAVRRITVGRCWRLPLVWKDFLFLTGGRSFFLVKFLAYGGMVAGCLWYQQMTRYSPDWTLQGDLAWTAFVWLLLILNVEVLLYSSGSLFAEVRQTTLSSLAMLPFSTLRILLEKAGACLIALLPVLLWTASVFLMDPAYIAGQCSATMVVTCLMVLLLSSHLTVLLSLYTRWAALPLAVLLTASSFMCCPMLIVQAFAVTSAVARSHNLRLGLLLGCCINLTWLWLFILLPIELQIVKRWNQLSQQ